MVTVGLPASTAKGQAVRMTLTNTGGQPASYGLTAEDPVKHIAARVSPAPGPIAPGASIEVVIQPPATYEGTMTVKGVMQGQPGNHFEASFGVRTA